MPATLTPQQSADLAAIRDQGPNAIRGLAEWLDALTPLPSQYETLCELVAERLGVTPETAAAILRPAVGIRRTLRDGDDSLDGISAAINSAIRDDSSGWSQQDLEAWSKVETAFASLASSRPIVAFAKFFELAYAYGPQLINSRILADVRPVFNEKNDDELAIEMAVVTFTLDVRYRDRSGDHGITISLDEADLLALFESCDRAIQKGELAKAMFGKSIPTAIAGE